MDWDVKTQREHSEGPLEKTTYHRPELVLRGDIRQLTKAGFTAGADAPMTGSFTPTS